MGGRDVGDATGSTNHITTQNTNQLSAVLQHYADIHSYSFRLRRQLTNISNNIGICSKRVKTIIKKVESQIAAIESNVAARKLANKLAV